MNSSVSRVRFLPLRLQPSGEPLRQRLARDGSRFDHDAGALERLEPAGFLRAPVEAGQLNERDGVGGQALAVTPAAPRCLRCRACRSGCAARGACARRTATASSPAMRELAPLEAGRR